MKRFFVTFIAAFLLLVAHAQSFKVSATVEGLPDGTVLMLTPISHSKIDPVAEATVKKGKCVFTGTITQDVPLCVRLQAKDTFGRTSFMVDKGDDINLSCTFTPDGDNKGVPIYRISDLKVTGSPLTDKYFEIKKEFGKYGGIGELRELMMKRMPKLAEAMKSVKSREDREALMKVNKDLQTYNYMDSIMYTVSNGSTIINLYKLGDSFWGPLMMLDVWWYFTPRERPVYEAFSDEAKNCWYGRNIRQELYPGGKPGEKVPGFTIKDQQGKTYTLAELAKGKKVVLLDFWASWCGPCRREIPNVKKQYELYKDKGFEVISISIDKDEAAWKKALDEEQLPWPNFLDRSGVADIYNVKSIPAMYLMEADGTIISEGMDARGEKLAAKLAALMK